MVNKWLSSLIDKEKTYIGSNYHSAYEKTVLTASPSFNWALGGRGFVFGRVPLFYGPEGSGKTLQALLMIAQVQKQDPEALGVFISSEFSFHKEWAKNMGVDLDRLLIKETNRPNEIFDWIETEVADQCSKGAPIRVIAIDSIKSIRGPKEMALEDSENFVMGDLSSYLQKAFKMIVETIRKYSILTILIQQVTEEFDEQKRKRGIKWNIPSGMALKHFCDYFCFFERIEAKDTKIFDEKIKMMNDNLTQVGHRVRITINKNRLDAPFRMGEFDINYKQGVINQHIEIGDLAINLGIVQRPNNLVYEFEGESWKGRSNFIDTLYNSSELTAKLYKRILENG